MEAVGPEESGNPREEREEGSVSTRGEDCQKRPREVECPAECSMHKRPRASEGQAVQSKQADDDYISDDEDNTIMEEEEGLEDAEQGDSGDPSSSVDEIDLHYKELVRSNSDLFAEVSLSFRGEMVDCF